MLRRILHLNDLGEELSVILLYSAVSHRNISQVLPSCSSQTVMVRSHRTRCSFLGAARLHVKSMQRRGQAQIRSDGTHEAVDVNAAARLRRLEGAATTARVTFFQLEHQIRMTRSRGSQSAVRISACRH